uniref:Skp1_POZ domain-containing protein n=1 Tax=Angiostrongylus cantonensis TaxID=6313 RepID=A0A0K0CU70_ANGCA
MDDVIDILPPDDELNFENVGISCEIEHISEHLLHLLIQKGETMRFHCIDILDHIRTSTTNNCMPEIIGRPAKFESIF